jgi:hypothetical protein
MPPGRDGRWSRGTGTKPASSPPPRTSRPRKTRHGQGQRPRSPQAPQPGHHAHDQRRPPPRLRLVPMATATSGTRPLPPLPGTPANRPLMTQELLSRPADQDLSGCPGPDLFASSLDELAADEGRCGRPCEQAAAAWHSRPGGARGRHRDAWPRTTSSRRTRPGRDRCHGSRQEMPDPAPRWRQHGRRLPRRPRTSCLFKAAAPLRATQGW